MSIIKIREQAVQKLMVPVVGALLVALLVSVFVGFGANRPAGQDGRTDSSGARIAFTANGQDVTDLDYITELQRARDRLREQRQPYGATQMSQMKMQLISSLIMRSLVMQEAEKADVKVSRRELNQEYDKQVEAQLDQYREALLGKDWKKKSDRDFEKELQARLEKSVRDLRKEIAAGIDKDALRNELVVRKFQDTIRSRVQLSDSALRDTYRTVNARHIFVSAKSRPEASAKKRAEEVLQKAKSGGDFAALAKQYSEDKMTADNGGLLAPISAGQDSPPGMMMFGQPSKEVRDAALRLKKPGDVSSIVKTPEGFEIVRLDSTKLELPKDFDKKKEDYRKQQQSVLADQMWAQTLEKIRDTAKIKFEDPEFEAYWLLSKMYASGMSEDSKKLMDQAAAAFQRHITQNADTSLADTSYVNLAQLQQMQGKNKEAAETLEKGLERFEDAYARLALARMYTTLGNKDKALEHYKMASEVTSDFMVHSQLQSVFTTEFPNAELAAKSKAIVDREMKRQEAMQPRPQPPAKPKDAKPARPAKGSDGESKTGR